MKKRSLGVISAGFLLISGISLAQPGSPASGPLTANCLPAPQNFPPPPPPPPPPSPEAQARAKEEAAQLSLAFVDKLQKIFDIAAASGTAEWGTIIKSLEELMREARTARDGMRIGEPFFVRYSRLIRVIKMNMMDDPERILQPVFMREIGAFVDDILAKGGSKSEPELSIARFSDACATEMTRLRLELMTTGKSKARQKR